VFSKDQVLSGRYRLISLQGRGGMASIYRAYDTTLERTVAIKVLRPEYDVADTFRHEARAIARLPHPNIVTVFDVGQHDGINYIVMEFIEGQDLKEWIEAEAPFHIGRALDVIVQVCEAVGFAHEQGILHCDLKPQNVLVLPSGQVKVADFGIARVLSSAAAGPNGKAWGTPNYASPELIAGKPLTSASDVYAIGVMLYEMLAGRLPFEGPDAVAVARQHALDAPPPIHRYNPRIPHNIAQILDRALAKDPARRYPTAKQLGRLLATYRRQGEAVTQPLQPIAEADAPMPAESVRAQPRPPQPQRLPAGSAPVPAPQFQPRKGFDWTLLLLAALAFVAVIGLVPLWGTVITRALAQQGISPTIIAPNPPPAAGTAEPTSTSTVESAVPIPPTSVATTATVPDLVGRSLDQARQLVQSAKLGWAVGEQRHDPQIPDQHVISQSPPASAQVPEGTEVVVAVSLGPEQVTMPDVIGFPVSVKRLDLEDLGLVVAVTDTWSTEPAGLIVRQEPEAGTEISVGSVVTLSVSTGSRSVIQANFDDKVVLHSAELNRMTLRPGDTLQILITWHVLERLPVPYTTFIHITEPNGRMATQLDRPPLGGSRPTDTWQAGEQLLDPYSLPLPTDMRPGSYWVRIGLYRGAQRLPVLEPGSARVENEAVIVHEITIQN
jgi:serine/threonine protein kinase